MLYDVEQAAIKLNVSKMTIYNKIKLNEFKSKTIKKAGKTYLDDDLINLIKDSLKIKNEVDSDNIEYDEKQEIAMDKDNLINLNKDLFDALSEQLKVKDMQIADLNSRLAAEQELTKNMQVLQLKQQPQNILQLEVHFKELDFKLAEIREEMQQRKNKNKLFSFFRKEY